jgi:outer membrane protein OmpA-like peptidoglycan-associated protein
MQRAIGLLICSTAGVASADTWMNAELPTAVAVSDVQQQAFRAGAMPAVGGYLSVGGHLALGARVRAGILRDGGRAATLVDGNRMDPSTGGLASAGLAARVMTGGAWLELVAGGGVTGSDVVPAFEAGAGYMFYFDQLSVGPSARYARLQASASDALGSAELLLVGVDFQFGHTRPRVVAHIVEAPPPVPPVAPVAVSVPIVPTAYDGDRILDSNPSCADLLEFLDADGNCGPGRMIEVAGDRIILDERVLFDTDHAHVHAAGRDLLRSLARAAAQHPEWITITIEGHTDARGGDAYNQALSDLRAERTRDAMIRAGFPPEQLRTVGYGRTHLRDYGTTPEAHQRNRRVEFAIDRAPRAGNAELP